MAGTSPNVLRFPAACLRYVHYKRPWAAARELDLVEQIGGTVEIVEASALNMKITTKTDLMIAEAIAASTKRT